MPNINSILSAAGYHPQMPPAAVPAVVPAPSVQQADSVAKADEVQESRAIERPLLTPPGELPQKPLPLSDYRLLAMTEESRELGNQILQGLSVRLSTIKEGIQRISAENIQKLREAAERASAKDFWSLLKKIATCLLSALSLVTGIALVASGGGALIGGAMIASGILSLANFALAELGAWDWVAEHLAHGNEDTKNKIAAALPAAVGILAGGIGLVGAVNGIASGALQFADKAVLVAQTALNLFDGVTTMGKGIADARLLWTKSDLAEIQAKLTVQRELFTSTMDEIKGSLNDFKQVKAKVKKAVDMMIQTNTQLARA